MLAWEAWVSWDIEILKKVDAKKKFLVEIKDAGQLYPLPFHPQYESLESLSHTRNGCISVWKWHLYIELQEARHKGIAANP
jgi:hypothetical protein